jgi:hypothetical protein
MIVEFSSPHADETMFLVETPEEGDALIREGIARGRVWSRPEVERLRVIEAEARPAIIDAKVRFDARLQETR